MEDYEDLTEKRMQSLDDVLSDILLQDRSSGKSLIWGTETYSSKGEGFQSKDHIKIPHVRSGGVIKPRVKKSKDEQNLRVRDKAEVFTPSWICNAQNNLIDEAWFGRVGVFNVEKNKTRKTCADPVRFPEDKSWRDYVRENRMEIACGEAPYLVSRYDTVTGEIIPLNDRIGLLDRKLRVVNENTFFEEDWYEWTKTAYRCIYGYDWQGDNVYLARENLLLSFIDYYSERFKHAPSLEKLTEIAYIISYNVWQMDGLNFVIPDCRESKNTSGVLCKIKDWKNNRSVKFAALTKGEKLFGAIAGNPPYQIMDGGAKASALPIYNRFAEQAIRLQAERISLIIPARWYAGGKGLDGFRKNMLNDVHMKVLCDYPDSADCFPSLGSNGIKGGLCYFLRDANHRDKCLIKTMGNGVCKSVGIRYLKEQDCDVFIRDAFGISILNKVRKFREKPFSDIVSARKPFGFATNFTDYDDRRKNDGQCVIYAFKKTGYIDRAKIKKNLEMTDKYKLYVPEAVGIADVSSDTVKPILGKPCTCCTETYLVVGPFDSEKIAENCAAYVSTKFFHYLLSLKKISQHTTRKCYEFIPCQDFTVDWTDDKLFKKYNFTKEEIAYIDALIWSERRKN